MKRIALTFLKLITVIIICTVLDWFAGYGESKNDIPLYEEWKIGTTGNSAFHCEDLENLTLYPRGEKAARRYDLALRRGSEPANNEENMFSASETSHMK